MRFTITVTDPDDDSAKDPATLVVKVKDPSGNETTYTYGVGTDIVTTGTGVYYINISVDEARTWYVQMTTTTPPDTDEYWFSVSPSEFD